MVVLILGYALNSTTWMYYHWWLLLRQIWEAKVPPTHHIHTVQLTSRQFVHNSWLLWHQRHSPCWSVLEFWKIMLENLNSTNWIFSLQKSIWKLIFAGSTDSENSVRNRLKIQFVELNFSKLIFQKSSTDHQRHCLEAALPNLRHFCLQHSSVE